MTGSKRRLAVCAAVIAVAGCGSQTVRATSTQQATNATRPLARGADFDEVAATRVLASDPIPAGNLTEWLDAARSTCHGSPRLAALGLVGYLTANTDAGEGEKATRSLQSMLAALRAGCPDEAVMIETEMSALDGITYS